MPTDYSEGHRVQCNDITTALLGNRKQQQHNDEPKNKSSCEIQYRYFHTTCRLRWGCSTQKRSIVNVLKNYLIKKIFLMFCRMI